MGVGGFRVEGPGLCTEEKTESPLRLRWIWFRLLAASAMTLPRRYKASRLTVLGGPGVGENSGAVATLVAATPRGSGGGGDARDEEGIVVVYVERKKIVS